MLSLNDPILEQSALFKLYIAMVRTSGDFPTPLWLSLDGPLGPNRPFSSGGFDLTEARLNNIAHTVCMPIFSESWLVTPTAHQVIPADCLSRAL